jgi:FKBP12-rapamycin complex-associated protein
MLQQIVTGLTSRSSDQKMAAAKRLQLHVSTELREVSAEQSTAFMEDLIHNIFEMTSSPDVCDKKGGILAIMVLIGVDQENATSMPRFANYLRNLLPSNDPVVMQMTARAMGRLALTGGTYTADYVEFELKQALEWLGSERNEARRHAAVLVLREMALNAPTFFFQQVQPFFDNIFAAVRDPKQAIREGAVESLRACLIILAQRETKQTQKQSCYSQIYDQAKHGFEDTTGTKEKGIMLTREDKVHGSLLLINELLRISCFEGERHRQELEDTYADNLEDLTSVDKLGSSPLKSRILQQSSSQSQHHLDVTLTGHSINDTHHCCSRICREYLEEKFDEICRLVFKFRSLRNSLIQQALLVLLPRLASFNPTKFVQKGYLRETIQYLSAAFKRERERSAAFKANGLVILAVRNQKKDLDLLAKMTFDQIKQALPMKDTGHKSKRQYSVDSMVFACISCLARAAGKSIYNQLKELLQPMLSVGLSPALTACLCDLARECTQLKKSIQDGLLTILSQILRSRARSTQPKSSNQPKTSNQPATPTGTAFSTDQTETSNIVLALRTLGSFDFDGHQLTHNKLIRHCSESFLASENKDIRMEAVRTCSRLLSPSVHPMVVPSAPLQTGPISPALEQLVSEVLEKLLLVGITDEDPDIRFCVLSSLDERFDSHLAQAECLEQLFVALNDEEFEIREVAICTIGRLSGLNPAYIMPTLRKALIQILTELEYSGVGRNKEQSAKMLGHLVRNAHRLIRPYMIPILKALIPKLQDQDPNVVTSILSAVGEHAQVCGTEMKRWLDELFPIIINMLQDASSLSKREISLTTLGQLVESTGYVVEPYQKYPNLLDVLLNFLKTEQASGIRKEAIRVLGLLGALDPYKHKLNQTGGIRIDSGVSQDTGENVESMDNTTSEILVNTGSGALEEFYPLAAIGALMRIMRNPSLSVQHPKVIQAVTFIFKSIGMKCVAYLPQVMPPYLTVIRTCDTSLRDYVFQQLGMLIGIVKQHIRSHLDEIFTLIKECWIMDSSLQTLIPLIETICVAMGGEFKIYLPQIIPQILKVFMHDNSKNRIYTLKLLTAFQEFGSSLDDYLHLMIPPVVKLFDSSDISNNVRRSALETIEKLCEQLDLTDFVSRIIHAIVRTLDTAPELRGPALATLCALVNQLGKKFITFIPMVNKVMLKHKISHKR